ncbi:MAG TPA: M56 family metallopeptidase [Chloroflexia bacterium]|nr:M56 family metallopeptidase [Chloroflexia bacterium]
MINLLLMAGGLVLTSLAQALILLLLGQTVNRSLRRGLQMLGLFLPLTLTFFFYLTGLPLILPLLDAGKLNEADRHYCLGALISLVLLGLPLLLSLLYNLVRLVLLYRRSIGQSWQAPAGMQALAKTETTARQVEVRLGPDRRSYAYNLPALSPRSPDRVILSLGLVERLAEDEVSSVIHHELAHLRRYDFWVIWLANCWFGAFIYLPLGRRFYQMLKEEQEYECDQMAAAMGGKGSGLALAEALLKVWEDLVQAERDKGTVKGFEAPGLASDSGPDLTEQRVIRLIEREQAGDSVGVLASSKRYQQLSFNLATCGVSWFLYVVGLIALIEPSGCFSVFK